MRYTDTSGKVTRIREGHYEVRAHGEVVIIKSGHAPRSKSVFWRAKAVGYPVHVFATKRDAVAFARETLLAREETGDE